MARPKKPTMPEELKEYLRSKYPLNDPTMNGWLKQRDEDIRELRDHGYALKEIAEFFQITYQRVQHRLRGVPRRDV